MFYVYAHKKGSDNRVFYVGKGHANRAWNYCQRSEWWERVKEKHGVITEILFETENEEEAYKKEIEIMDKLRLEGHPLVNIYPGGKGAPCREVFCSNGMRFTSIQEASFFLIEEFGIKTNGNHVSSCANGKIKSAHGFNWSFLKTPSPPVSRRGSSVKSRGVKLFCSNGKCFDSITLARDWVRENTKYKNASQSTINEASREKGRSAYGFAWSRKDFPGKPLGKKHYGAKHFGKKVECSNGMIFDSISEAARWLSKELGKTCYNNNIVRHLKGHIKKAYGYTWRYLD